MLPFTVYSLMVLAYSQRCAIITTILEQTVSYILLTHPSPEQLPASFLGLEMCLSDTPMIAHVACDACARCLSLKCDFPMLQHVSTVLFYCCILLHLCILHISFSHEQLTCMLAVSPCSFMNALLCTHTPAVWTACLSWGMTGSGLLGHTVTPCLTL